MMAFARSGRVRAWVSHVQRLASNFSHWRVALGAGQSRTCSVFSKAAQRGHSACVCSLLRCRTLPTGAKPALTQ